MINTLKVGLILFFFAVGGFAQTLSPEQKFQVHIHNKYEMTFPPAEIYQFLNMPWVLAERERAERVLGATAIRAVGKLGDNFHPLLAFNDQELKEIVPQFVDLIAGEFGEFWTKITPNTKRAVVENPGYAKKLLCILNELNASPNALSYKQRLGMYPDLLVPLWRLPSLLNVPPEHLPSLAHFLQYIDFSDRSKKDMMPLSELDKSIRKWWSSLLQLYKSTAQNGPGIALTMLAVPDFFKTGSTESKVDDEHNLTTASLLLGHIDFISERKDVSLDWNSDVKKINEILHRTPNQNSMLGEKDWRDFLVRMAPTEGKVLKILWDMLSDVSKMDSIDSLLGKLKQHKVDTIVMLGIFRLVETPEDLDLVVSFANDPFYDVPNQQKQIPVPISTLCELSATNVKGDEVLDLLKKHKHRFVAYLNDRKRGKTVYDRYQLALKTELKDAEYDDSQIKTIVRLVPGGNLANVAFKAAKGYPVSKLEIAFAALDAVKIAADIATMGGASAATQATETVTEKSAEKIIDKTAEVAAEKTAEVAAEKAAEEWAQKIIKWAIETGIGETVEMIDKEINAELEKREITRRDEFLLTRSGTCDVNISNIEELVKHFTFLPIRQPGTTSRLLRRVGGNDLEINFPKKPKDWFATLDSKEQYNSILLITIGDLL